MKVLWLFIYLTFDIIVQHVHANNIEIYVSILDTVVMNCRLESNTELAAIRWRREGTTIAQRSVLMSAFKNNRFQIIGDQNKGVYNLKILNVTKEDMGKYQCETQVLNTIAITSYMLKLKEYKSTAFKETISTQNNIATGNTDASGESMSTTFDEKKKATEKPFLDMSTDSNSHMDLNETPRGTGQSFRENFYYGLLAVGLVLVLCLSIICNACINRKCKTAVIKTTGNVQQDNSLNAQANHMTHLGRFDNDVEEYISHYETINESEMLPKHVFAVITEATNKPKHRSSASDKVYLEIMEDDLTQKRSKETDNELCILNRSETLVDPKDVPLQENNLDSNTDAATPSLVDEPLDSDGSSSDSDNITCSNTYGYLHPYIALNANDMEYLNSYSSVTNVDQAICVESLKLPDSDSSSCLKKEITLDEKVGVIPSCRRFNANNDNDSLQVLVSDKCLKDKEMTSFDNDDYTDGLSPKTNLC